MARIVWMGVGGVALALLVSPWLSQPSSQPAAEPPLERPAPSAELVPLASVLPGPARPPVEAPAVPPGPSAAPVSEPGVGAAPRPWRRSTQARRKLPEQRQRIVDALRADYANPRERRDAVLAAFQSSGDSQSPWTEQAREALVSWRTTIEAEVLPVRAEPPRCFTAGCVSRVTFPDAASYEEARQRVPGLMLTGVGPRLQLPPEYLPSGEVVVSWAVLPPENP
ncbi:hypothetical protein JRI60_14750 [Archangium violaceum]|uniref:hypothetical protein n=1 Tax=Archangium violaceum TaxID=83451 RepID=UPI001951DE23|nr:hypothetical protein [Archangium violaceum]QRO00183.1 hypothetical protein JRI60_14750 [Archangium violaceum]